LEKRKISRTWRDSNQNLLVFQLQSSRYNGCAIYSEIMGRRYELHRS
jgi:hypothetical protein